MKIFLTLTVLALLSGSAMASDDYTDTTRCSPIIGNWVNAATMNCASKADADNNSDRIGPVRQSQPCGTKSS